MLLLEASWMNYKILAGLQRRICYRRPVFSKPFKIFNKQDKKARLYRPLYGKLSDIFGRKTCLLFAYTVFAVRCGLSRTMTELIASRALSGIGGGRMQT